MTRTSIVCTVSPGAKVTVPVARSKSVPELAEFVMVWYSAVTVSVEALDSDTVKEASTYPVSPSVT